MFGCVYVRNADAGYTPDALLACVAGISPLFQLPDPRTALVDIRGLGKLFGDIQGVAATLLERAAAVSLDVNASIAANIDTAIAAAKGFPGITVILAGEEARVLAPLALSLLNPSEDVAATLLCWGICTFGELAALPEKGVAERLGAEGLFLQKLSRGWVRRPLVPYTDQLTFEDSIELEHPLELLEPLSFLLSRILNGLCARLVQQALATNHIELILGLEDGLDFTRTISLPYAGCDAAGFLKLLQYDLEAHPPKSPIAKVTIRLTPVEPRRLQNGLFQPVAPEAEKLELTLARISAIVGEGNAGTPELLNTHRPDAFRLKKFDANASHQARPLGPMQLGLRRYRPPLPAQVDTGNGTPRRISARGVTGRITAYAGPWRSCGEWWRDDAWDRDEWDVRLDNGGLYRIFCDRTGNWFVDANYD